MVRLVITSISSSPPRVSQIQLFLCAFSIFYVHHGGGDERCRQAVLFLWTGFLSWFSWDVQLKLHLKPTLDGFMMLEAGKSQEHMHFQFRNAQVA